MSDSGACPKCGAPLPSATEPCPRCLMANAGESSGQRRLGPGFLDDLPMPVEALVIADKYTVLEIIARGGMGVVYKARQENLNRLVAVKMLLGGAHASEDYKRRFVQEAKAAAALNHPNIVAIHDWGEDSGQPFFSMDYIEGRTLAEMTREQPLPGRAAAEIVRTLAQAMHYAHGQGVLHRDLKPSNVLVDAAGVPRLTDFGLARQLDQATLLTGSGDLLGTPGYLPPEQTSTRTGAMGAWSDVYGLGGIFYHLLTGRAPFVAGTTAEVLRAVMESEPVAVRQLNPSAPVELDTICLKCLEKEPSRRYQSAQEVADELGRWLRGEPILARPVSAWARARKWAARHPATAGLSGALLASLVLGLGTTFWQWQRAAGQARLAIERGNLAEDRRRLMRRAYYAADTALAQKSYDEGNVARAREFLRGQKLEPGDENLAGLEWRYLVQAASRDASRVLTGHVATVTALAVSPDGRFLVSGAIEATVRIWDTRTGTLVRQEIVPGTAGRANGILSIAFSPDGRNLALATAYDVRVFSWPDWNPLRVLPGQYARVAWSPDGRWLAVGDGSNNQTFGLGGGQVTLYDATTGARARQFPNVGSRVAFVPGKAWLVAGVASNAITIWDCATGQLVQRLLDGGDGATALAVSPDGRLLARSDSTERIAVWDMASGKLLPPLQGQRYAVYQVAFSPDGQWLLSVGGDQTMRRWNTNNWEASGIWRGHEDQVNSLAIAPDGSQIFTGAKDETVRVWSPEPPGAAPPLLTNATTMLLLSIRPQASGPPLDCLVLGDGRSSVSCWQLQSNRPLWRLTNETKALAVSADQRFLATANTNRDVSLFDTAGGLRLAGPLHREKDPKGVPAVAFSADSRWLAVGGELGYLYFYSLGPKQPVQVVRGHTDVLLDLLFTPDSRTLLAACRDRKVSIWSVSDHNLIGTIEGHKDAVWGLAFSPDGKTLATGSRDNTVRLWEWPSRRPLAVLRGHGSRVLQVAFTPDNRTLLSGSDDGTLRFWHLPTHRELAAVRLETGVTSFALSPGADAIYTLDAARNVRRWPAPFPAIPP